MKSAAFGCVSAEEPVGDPGVDAIEDRRKLGEELAVAGAADGEDEAADHAA